MIADKFKTNLNDISRYFVPSSQYDFVPIKDKTSAILKNGFKNTFFIYEPLEFEYFCGLLVAVRSLHIN